MKEMGTIVSLAPLLFVVLRDMIWSLNRSGAYKLSAIAFVAIAVYTFGAMISSAFELKSALLHRQRVIETIQRDFSYKVTIDRSNERTGERRYKTGSGELPGAGGRRW
mmetsp:Transcript_5402/g.10752  ORF Transcript_5402/g.10752 Transcript_5402/m.10752 type:complete len:108 (+) Transcript_5402:1018-1341(+)